MQHACATAPSTAAHHDEEGKYKVPFGLFKDSHKAIVEAKLGRSKHTLRDGGACANTNAHKSAS